MSRSLTMRAECGQIRIKRCAVSSVIGTDVCIGDLRGPANCVDLPLNRTKRAATC